MDRQKEKDIGENEGRKTVRAEPGMQKPQSYCCHHRPEYTGLGEGKGTASFPLPKVKGLGWGRRARYRATENYPQALKSNEVYPLVMDLFRTCDLFNSSNIFLLKCRYLSYAFLSLYFGS